MYLLQHEPLGQRSDVLQPTLHGMSGGRLAPPPGLVTDPRFAALARDLHPARCLAPHPGWQRLIAQAQAADGTVHAQALVLAVGLEALAIAVDDAVILAPSAH